MPSKNNLKMNKNGNLYPSQTFDKRRDFITSPTTNLNSAPLFYIGHRVNVLSSSTSPSAIGIMRFGNNNYSLHEVFGNNKITTGNLIPTNYPNLNLNIDDKGNYKLMDLSGNTHKIYSNSRGNYVKYRNRQFHL
jgi:hypothetical protein